MKCFWGRPAAAEITITGPMQPRFLLTTEVLAAQGRPCKNRNAQREAGAVGAVASAQAGRATRHGEPGTWPRTCRFPSPAGPILRPVWQHRVSRDAMHGTPRLHAQCADTKKQLQRRGKVLHALARPHVALHSRAEGRGSTWRRHTGVPASTAALSFLLTLLCTSARACARGISASSRHKLWRFWCSSQCVDDPLVRGGFGTFQLMHTVPVPSVIPQAPPNREELLRTVEHGSVRQCSGRWSFLREFCRREARSALSKYFLGNSDVARDGRRAPAGGSCSRAAVSVHCARSRHKRNIVVTRNN